MNKILRYTIFFCVFLAAFSCKKKHDLTIKEDTARTTKEQQYISVSNVALKTVLQNIKNDSSSFLLKNKDSVIAFYELRNGNAAWKSLKNRSELYSAIQTADKEGLIPEDYNVTKILNIVNSNAFNRTDNIAIDLLFTDTYLSFAYHLANGKVDPKKLYDDWKLTPNKFKFNSLLNNSLNKNTLHKSIEQYKPQQKTYKQLKTQLPIAKALIHKDSLKTKVIHGEKIRPNNTDDRIINIRKRLNELGFLKDSLVTQSKVLDTILQEGIREFQASKKLKTDAIIGTATVDALNESYLDNYNSVLANLERWRWFPRKMGDDYILVNIANYQLKHITSKDTTQYNIIVGKTARKTPVFSSTISYLDFNPKWYIPPTIKREDVIPAASKDLDYLRRKNISVFNNQGKQLVLDSINWESNLPSSYRYVQSSGSNNALGRVKIIFPNKFSVYLHDTPSKSLFKKNYRARSSGCVRVQNVFALAGDILNLSDKKINKLVDSKLTKRIYVEKDIKVHFLYWSVVFNESSEPTFLNDVYKFDKYLAQLLAN